MQPSLVTPEIIDSYINAGHWSRETMLDRYCFYTANLPEHIACVDSEEQFNWAELDEASSQLAGQLIDLGLERDSTALVQIPSSCREIILRVALKKAGIIGVFVPLQWRKKELSYVTKRVSPALFVISGMYTDPGVEEWLNGAAIQSHRLDLGNKPKADWISWQNLQSHQPLQPLFKKIEQRKFKFDEVSLITASSGTSGLAKLCEWPEGAQLCQSRVLQERMEIKSEDKIGIFAPTAGAAGLMMWMVSWTVPCTCIFPKTYNPANLLELVAKTKITVGTTVPVILARLSQEPMEEWDLSSLRLMRVGTAAADMSAARTFEDRSGCRVVVASGSMECTGFGHAHVNEPRALRLNGSVGLPLDGCKLRIEDGNGNKMPAGEAGELKVTAPFSSSGYWKDPEETAAVWCDGWYSTGDIGVLDGNGRLTLLGRIKETINRSGHKILPAEVEKEITRLPGIVECSVIGVQDKEYGHIPWAFLQMRSGEVLDSELIIKFLRKQGIASYKIPDRFIQVEAFPRINDSKVDKITLRKMALSFKSGKT